MSADDTGKSRLSVKLTKRAVEALAYDGAGNGACYVWDSEVKGFGVRIYPGGRKAFLVAYRSGARKRFLTLGTFGKDLTADEARKLAIVALGDVVRGTDPAEVREKERQGETVKDLCDAYMVRHGDAKKSGAADLRRIKAHLLPAWGRLKARAITRPDVAALHTKIGKTAPYEANRTLALLSKMFELAGAGVSSPRGTRTRPGTLTDSGKRSATAGLRPRNCPGWPRRSTRNQTSRPGLPCGCTC